MNLKKIQILILFLSSALIMLLIFPSICLAAEWTQFQTDTQNTGVTSDKAPITFPESVLCWNTYTVGNGMAGIDVVPLVVGDMVYVATCEGNVRAYSIETGQLQWIRISSSSGFLTGNLAYGDGNLFVPTNTGQIHAFDALTGEQQWNVKVSSGELDSPITFSENKIYFGDFAGENKYYCYDDSGVECWNRSSSGGEQYKWAGAAVAGTYGDYLVFGDDGSYLTSVYKNNGTTVDELIVSSLWSDFNAKEIRSSICYNEQNSRIYFTSEAGYCYAIGMNPDGTFNSADALRQYLGSSSTSTPVVYNDRVYVGAGLFGSSGKFCCMNESDLSLVWDYTPNGGVQASPVVSTAHDDGDGDVYIYFTTNTDDSKVYCLKDFPGNTLAAVQWEYQPATEKNGYALQGVSISDGRLFFGNDKGYLFSLATAESLTTQYTFAGFAANMTSGDVPLTVKFTDQSADAIIWRWDVDGDGNTDYTVKNPVHTYDESGVYNVTLTVIGSQGVDTKMKESYINVDWNPWNNPDSGDGALISRLEVQSGLIMWKKQITLSNGHTLSRTEVQKLLLNWKKQIPM